MNDIDFLVGVYGWGSDIDAKIESFLRGLRNKCNLSGVNVWCVEREHRPITSYLRGVIHQLDFYMRTCPIPPASNSCDDTSSFTNWMVATTCASWFIVSHFDVSFNGDYIGYVRSLMGSADMIGEHHNGIMAVKRSAYDECGVGFYGADCMCFDEYRVLPSNHPNVTNRKLIQMLDVGELLSIRMNTLGKNHVWLRRAEEVGKSDLFDHSRQGSGHGVQ